MRLRFFVLLLLPPCFCPADEALPEEALRKAEPVERYRERFQTARPFDESHKSLEHVRFRCELATFAPITYNATQEQPVRDPRTQRQKKHVFKSDDFVVKKVTAWEFHYQAIPENAGRFRSHYEDSAAQVLRRSDQFVSVVRTKSYPGKPGSMASIVEARVSPTGDVLMEVSYRIAGWTPDSDAKKPVSRTAQAEGPGVFADDYVTCRRTGEMVLGEGK